MSNSVEDIAIFMPGEGFAENQVEEVINFFSVGGEPRILSVVAIDSTHIRVTFVRPLVNDVSVTCMEVWNIISNTVGARDIEVRGLVLEVSEGVTAGSGDTVASILFTVDEMLDLADYDFEMLLPREA